MLMLDAISVRDDKDTFWNNHFYVIDLLYYSRQYNTFARCGMGGALWRCVCGMGGAL